MCILKMVAIFGYNHFFMLTKEDVENIFQEFKDEGYSVSVWDRTKDKIKAKYSVRFGFGTSHEMPNRDKIKKQLDRFTKNYQFKYLVKRVVIDVDRNIEIFLTPLETK